MKELNFRKLNPRNDEDMESFKYLSSKLCEHLNQEFNFNEEYLNYMRFHMGAIEYIDERLKGGELPKVEDNAREFVEVCECEGKCIGMIHYNNYYITDDKVYHKDIANIIEIFVLDEFRGGDIAFKLLKSAVTSLTDKGISKARCNVQEDNPYRFLHFAMADRNIVETSETTRINGAKTINYCLEIDLEKLKDLTYMQFVKKIAKTRKDMLQQQNIEEELQK